MNIKLGGGDLEVWEIVLCTMAFAGHFFSAYFMAHLFEEKRCFPVYLALYGLVVFGPTLLVILYAFSKMTND